VGIFSAIGTAVGSFFGGPIGGAVGSALGGALDGGRGGGGGGASTQTSSSTQNQTIDQTINVDPNIGIGVGIENIIDVSPIALALDRGNASVAALFERSDITQREIALANAAAQTATGELFAAAQVVQAQANVTAANVAAQSSEERTAEILKFAKVALVGAGVVMLMKRAA